MGTPQIHIFRHQNNVLVDQFMEHFRFDLDPKKNLANQTAVNATYLKVMKALAGMRETANRSKMGFFGGFVTPEGFHYSVSNVDPNNAIENCSQLAPENYIDIDEGFTIEELYKKLRIISTPEGVQLRLTDNNE